MRAIYSYKNASSGVQYGKAKTYGSGANRYPNLYAKENGSGINTTTVKTNGIGISENGYDTPTTETSSIANNGLTITQTYYNFNSMPKEYFYNSEIYDMIFNVERYYWLGSRCNNCHLIPDFGIFNIGNLYIGGRNMISGDGTIGYSDRYIRPQVCLNTNLQLIECKGENSSTNMHTINKK